MVGANSACEPPSILCYLCAMTNIIFFRDNSGGKTVTKKLNQETTMRCDVRADTPRRQGVLSDDDN
jgi:hypothetical protein